MTYAFDPPPRPVLDADDPDPKRTAERPDWRGFDCAMDCIIFNPRPGSDAEAGVSLSADPEWLL